MTQLRDKKNITRFSLVWNHYTWSNFRVNQSNHLSFSNIHFQCVNARRWREGCLRHQTSPSCVQSQKPFYYFPLCEQWGLNSKCTVATLLSCEDGNKRKPVSLKTFAWCSPPTRPAKKNVNKRRQEEHQVGVNFGVWERTGKGEGGRGREGCCFFVRSVYITKKESLEYNRPVPQSNGSEFSHAACRGQRGSSEGLLRCEDYFKTRERELGAARLVEVRVIKLD